MGKPVSSLLPRPDRFALGLFFSKLEVCEDGCWLWRASRGWGGYGMFGGASAHRVSYRWFVGEIPYGLHLDHLCRHRWCVNPAHLEVVTRTENIRRGLRAGAFDDMGWCQHGHRMTPDNIGTQSNGVARGRFRICLACQKVRHERQKQKRHAAKVTQPLTESRLNCLETGTR